MTALWFFLANIYVIYWLVNFVVQWESMTILQTAKKAHADAATAADADEAADTVLINPRKCK